LVGPLEPAKGAGLLEFEGKTTDDTAHCGEERPIVWVLAGPLPRSPCLSELSSLPVHFGVWEAPFGFPQAAKFDFLWVKTWILARAFVS
jgi:hypothetical protein